MKDIEIDERVTLGNILDSYCEEVEEIPTEKGKEFFRKWEGKVPPMLIRQCIMAGIFFAYNYPNKIKLK